MSDFEINKLVAFAVYSDLMGMDFTKNLKEKYSLDHGETVIMYCGKVLDYCNDPSDAWPIIFKNEITVITGADCDGDYQAVFLDGYFEQLVIESADEIHASFKFSAFSKSPLRAAMICFLKMKNGE